MNELRNNPEFELSDDEIKAKIIGYFDENPAEKDFAIARCGSFDNIPPAITENHINFIKRLICNFDKFNSYDELQEVQDSWRMSRGAEQGMEVDVIRSAVSNLVSSAFAELSNPDHYKETSDQIQAEKQKFINQFMGEK